jgi:hypothetical protein
MSRDIPSIGLRHLALVLLPTLANPWKRIIGICAGEGFDIMFVDYQKGGVMQLNDTLVKAFIAVIAFGLVLLALTSLGEFILPIAILAIIGFFVYEWLKGIV